MDGENREVATGAPCHECRHYGARGDRPVLRQAVDDLLKATPQGLPFLVDVNEAVRLLGISRSALYRLIDKGHLHSVKIFGSMRIRRSEIEAFNGTDTSIGTEHR